MTENKGIETRATILGSEECETCVGAGRINNADTKEPRKCLDCGGDGRTTKGIPVPKLVMHPIARGDKEIFIDSVDDDGYHAIRIQLSRDDCDTLFAENFAKFLVAACNQYAAKVSQQ